MDFKERASQVLAHHLEQWESDPSRLENAYNYEASYAAMIQEFNRELLQVSLGKLPKSKNAKKNFTPDSEE